MLDADATITHKFRAAGPYLFNQSYRRRGAMLALWSGSPRAWLADARKGRAQTCVLRTSQPSNPTAQAVQKCGHCPLPAFGLNLGGVRATAAITG